MTVEIGDHFESIAMGQFGISSFTVRSVRGLVILIIVNFILMLLQVQCGSRSRLAIRFVYFYLYNYKL